METETIIPLFEPNQILSSTHLNQLREYLDNENRYSRIKLSGVGIACGLQLKSYSAAQIVVTTGYGITTDGFLLDLVNPSGAGTITYTRYQPYIDPMVPAYNFGKSPATDSRWHESSGSESLEEKTSGKKKAAKNGGSSAKPLKDDTVLPEIFELFTSAVTDYDEDAKPLTGFESDPQVKKKLDDMALVYLCEFDDADLKSCTGTNCDNKGKRRDVTLRMLLVPVTRLIAYRTEEYLKKNDVLPFVNIPRLGFDQLKNISGNATLKSAYETNIITKQADKLKENITNAYNSYGYLLGLTKQHYPAALKKLDTIAPEYIGKNATYIQYIADALNDVSQTFNEFAEEAWIFLRSCGKVPETFPRHLTIAQFQPPNSKPYDELRTVFFNVPPVDKQDLHLQNARMLFGKMLKMLLFFQDASQRTISENNIKITPDGTAQQPFSERSVPYYYASDQVADVPHLKDLVASWNADRTVRGRENERYGYYAQKYNAPDPFATPLGFSLLQAPMLRIEGIAGVNVVKAKEKLETLRKQHNLDFDIQLLRLQSDAIDFNDDYHCELEDLQADYLIAREEIICCVKSLYNSLTLLNSDRSGIKALIAFGSASKEEKHRWEEIKEDKRYGEQYDLLLDELEKIASAFLTKKSGAFDDVYEALPYALKQFDYRKFLRTFKLLQHGAAQYRVLFESLAVMLKDMLRNIEMTFSDWYDHDKLWRLLDKIRALNCHCSYPKLGILEALREQRLKVKAESSLFTNFIAANPGAEHYAAVPHRGTICLVYSKEKLYAGGPDNQVVADFTLGGSCCGAACYPAEDDIKQPLVAIYDEVNVTLRTLAKEKELEIDVLKNDYYIGHPEERLKNIEITVVETDDSKNAGKITISEKESYPTVVYTLDGKNPTVDFFLLKITDTKKGLYDYSTLVVNVSDASSYILNTRPDKAATLAEKKVSINVMMNDYNRYGPEKEVRIILIDKDGKRYEPGDKCPTRKGNTAVVNEKPLSHLVIFDAANTKADSIKETITDSFEYMLIDEAGNQSMPTTVEVDILPCCDTKLRFDIKRTFCKNDPPEEFQIEVPGGVTETLVVTGPGVTGKSGVWRFNPADDEVKTTDVKFTLMYRDTKQVLGEIAAKVHPIASFEGQAVAYMVSTGTYLGVGCESVVLDAEFVQWFVNGQEVPGTATSMVYQTLSGPVSVVNVTLKAYHKLPSLDPNCYHEVSKDFDVQVINPAHGFLPGSETVTRYTNTLETIRDIKFTSAVTPGDPKLENDAAKVSYDVSSVLLDKSKFDKLKPSRKEALVNEATSLLGRLNVATTKVTDPDPQAKTAVYDVYKNNTVDALNLVVATVGTGKPSAAESAALAEIGNHLVELKNAGQLDAQTVAEISKVSGGSNAALTKSLNEIKSRIKP